MSTRTTTDGMVEPCDDCGIETLHAVRIEIVTESSRARNAEYSREPYRVTTCRLCGTETAQRMNNA